MSWTHTSAPDVGYNYLRSSPTGLTLYATSAGNGIYISTDRGVTWVLSNNGAPSSNSWVSITSSSDGQYLAACAYNSNGLYTSSNSGASWTKQTGGSVPASFINISGSSDGSKLVASSYLPSNIYTSTNYGVTWTIRNTNGAPTGNIQRVRSNSDGTKLVAVTSTSGIFVSSNSGANWTLTSALTNVEWYDVASDLTGTKLVACVISSGGIYTSNNSGTTWTLRSSAPTNVSWSTVASNSDGTKLLASNNNTAIYQSIDSGITWTVTNAPLNAHWWAVAISGDGTTLSAAAYPSGSTGGIYVYSQSPSPSLPCFKEGTQILTIDGYVPVQDLRQGDLVKTLKHNYVPINMIGKSTIYNSGNADRIKNKLYRLCKQEYKEIFEDLIITGCHSILVGDFVSNLQRDKVIEINGYAYITDNKYRLPAVADERAEPYEKEGDFTIYHIALDHDDYFMNYGIYANGLLVESCSKRYLMELSGMKLI